MSIHTMDASYLNKINISSVKTMGIVEASVFLGAHKETIRRLVVAGKIPAVKIGRGWHFIEQDLVLYMRSQYSSRVTSQGAVDRSNNKWRFTKGKQLGGLVSPIKEKEYKEALGLKIK